MLDEIRRQLAESIETKQRVAEQLTPEIAQAAQMMIDCLQAGGLVAFCGNGGSAADSQHLAGEFISRFRRERRAYRGVALTTDTSILSAIGNDYGYERVFSRQVQGLMGAGDVLVAISTSGKAENCLLAVEMARSLGAKTIGLTGATGGDLKDAVDLCLCVPSTDTPRIQESHITIGHIICDLVEMALTEGDCGA
jgi:D-sedoheptulose 7-phosphate isomerase